MEILFVILGFCFLFAIGYSVGAIIFYPVYVALGGKKNIRDYIKNL